MVEEDVPGHKSKDAKPCNDDACPQDDGYDVQKYSHDGVWLDLAFFAENVVVS